MLHPFNMDPTFYEIVTARGSKRKVSNRKYRLLPSIAKTCRTFDYLAGRVVRLISLYEGTMPGVYPSLEGAMATVALEDALVNPSTFNEQGSGDGRDWTKIGIIGVDFKDLAPL